MFALATACANSTTQTVLQPTEKSIVLTNQQAWDIYKKYVEGWRAIPDETRTKIAAEVIAEAASYSTPLHAIGGRQTIIEDERAFQKKFPGGHFDVGDVSAHHDVALLTWLLVQADGTVAARGHDQIRVAPDGRIVDLITFAPSVTSP
jgi:SnoaL-like domain